MKLFLALVGSSLGCGLYGPPPAPRATTTTTTTTTTRAPTACELRRSEEQQKYENGEQTGIVRCNADGAWMPTVVQELQQGKNVGDEVWSYESWCITTNSNVQPAGSRIAGTLQLFPTRQAARSRDAECRDKEAELQ